MWIFLEYLAWAASAALLLSMLWDAIRIERSYDEATLTSSREGIDELIEHGVILETPLEGRR